MSSMRQPMCSPKTMLKIGIAIAVPLAVGFIAFPQFRTAISGLAPLAPFALFALCPLSMIIGMASMKGGKQDEHCSSCGENHTSTKHLESKLLTSNERG